MVHFIVAELDHTIATENENLLSHSQAEMRDNKSRQIEDRESSLRKNGRVGLSDLIRIPIQEDRFVIFSPDFQQI